MLLARASRKHEQREGRNREQNELDHAVAEPATRWTNEVPDQVARCNVECVDRSPGRDPGTTAPESPCAGPKDRPMEWCRRPCERAVKLEPEPHLGVTSVRNEEIPKDQEEERRDTEERQALPPDGPARISGGTGIEMASGHVGNVARPLRFVILCAGRNFAMCQRSQMQTRDRAPTNTH
jgi:hypothetical protein